MDKIGIRAAHAIKTRARKNKSKLGVELRELHMSHAVLHKWGKGETDPSAFFLARMALAGYDVLWILTGEVKNGYSV